ncbi:MAG: hypothetical protein QM504_06780 [Pseudomonadota bacterium]
MIEKVLLKRKLRALQGSSGLYLTELFPDNWLEMNKSEQLEFIDSKKSQVFEDYAADHILEEIVDSVCLTSLDPENYFESLRVLESRICEELDDLLDTGFTLDDEKLEFFNLATVIEQEITEFDDKGLILSGFQKDNTISQLVSSGALLLNDVISLVNELRKLSLG